MKSTVRIGIGIIIFAAFAAITWTISNNGLQAQPLDSLGSQGSMPASQTAVNPFRSFNEDGSVRFLTEASDGAPLDIAADFVQQHQDDLGLTTTDLDGMNIEYYTTEASGMTHIQYYQHLDGITVYNSMVLINIALDGSVINVHNQAIANLAAQVNSNVPGIAAIDAVRLAAADRGLEMDNSLSLLEAIGGDAYAAIFSSAGIATHNIPTKLVYLPMEDGSVRLTWEVSIEQKDQPNWWVIYVDAQNGNILHIDNLVVHEDFIQQATDAHGSKYVDRVRAQAQTNGSSHTEIINEANNLFGPNRSDLSNALLSPDEYFVFPLPMESPNHLIPPESDDPPLTEDHRFLELDPATAAASPFGWHDINGSTGAEYTITRGNNAHAYEDSGNNNASVGNEPDGGAGLVFSYTLNLTQNPSTYQDAAVTNLFYWNNLTHDFSYAYGFDEAAGNFQENNYGKGGSGSDYVYAEAQDGLGTCNANFGTPADGSNPRMQMYLCNLASPLRDGDFDNGVIVHEYTHGISNRLTGGPSASSCLNNTEQMGEGWSDWLALMMTIEAGDLGTDSRGMGTYLFGEASTGPGIRPNPYSTNFGINNRTYGDINDGDISVPHGVGFLWATMIWDMNWNLINNGVSQSGLDLDIFNGTGGNNLALQLVMDGMKLQPCSPGYVDGRDAILLADQNFTGGANQCVIWEAFAQRGLGASADQGSSGSRADGTEAFDLPATCLQTLKLDKTANPDPISAGSNLTYTLVGSNDTLGTLTNVVISDTIQTGQAYVPASATCGGSESGGVVTFPLGTLTSGQAMTCTFQITIDNGISSTEFFFDDFEDGSLGNWTTTGLWNPETEGDTCGSTVAPFPSSNNAAYYGDDAGCDYDTGSQTVGTLTMNTAVALTGNPILKFWSYEDTEDNASYDKKFAEISTNGGTTWTTLGQLTSENAWYEKSFDLSAYAGSSALIRFRFDSSDGLFNTDLGWLIDDVLIIDEASVSNTACVEAAEGDNDCDSVTTLVDGISMVTWNGSVDTDWANSANWTPNQVPNTGISALIPSGPTIWPQISGVVEALNLTIDADAELSIMDGGSLSVEGVMVNNGRFAQTIATVPGSGSRFLYIQNQADTVDKYLGVDITPNTGMTGVTATIRGHQECTTVAGEAIQRCFDISVTGSDTANITFHYLESERNGLTASNMEVYHWSGTQPWTFAGTFDSRDDTGPDYSVTITGVSSFSPFVLAESGPTAVSLQSISADNTTDILPIALLTTLLLVLMGGVVLRRRNG